MQNLSQMMAHHRSAYSTSRTNWSFSVSPTQGRQHALHLRPPNKYDVHQYDDQMINCQYYISAKRHPKTLHLHAKSIIYIQEAKRPTTSRTAENQSGSCVSNLHNPRRHCFWQDKTRTQVHTTSHSPSFYLWLQHKHSSTITYQQSSAPHIRQICLSTYSLTRQTGQLNHRTKSHTFHRITNAPILK